MDRFLPLLESYKIPLALSLVGAVLIIGSLTLSESKKPSSGDFPRESITQGFKTLAVDVSGAVNNPGVYNLKDGARMEEAVKAAGGFSADVNQEYISKYLNMAQKLVDGTKVYIPFDSENITNKQSLRSDDLRQSDVAGVATNAQQININTASSQELEALPGIGPVTAEKIISGRPYNKIEELVGKKVLGNALFNKVKDRLVVY